MEKKLEVKNLQVSFRTQGGIVKAVRNISFDLYKGETLAIVGESGSGKSVTSKSIIGILQGNSIIEGGEILYDGQDLLKISEEDYHKIRGDKIAMIFQDPMSSLNPIMKVGQQLTEAMILKTKTSTKNARNAFNSLLKVLNQNIDEAKKDESGYDSKKTAEQIKTFDNFCIENCKIERIYNEAMAEAIELELNIDNTVFFIEKKQKADYYKKLKEIRRSINQCYHPYVLVSDEHLSNICAEIDDLIAGKKNVSYQDYVKPLKELKKIIHGVTLKQKPNFFTLGYYKFRNPNEDVSSLEVNELDKMTHDFLYQDFMLNFIELAKSGVENSHKKSIKTKEKLVDLVENAIEYFKTGEIEHDVSFTKAKEISAIVRQGIDRLAIKKNSSEYVFSSAIITALNTYFDGKKTNPIEEKRFLERKAKYDKLVENGKNPDYELKPQIKVDLDLAIENICHVLENLLNSIKNDIANKDSFSSLDHVVKIIDFLKEQASKAVEKMNKKIAKAKAIKLLEEVGIPEPAIRYNQYPFEFSGGMRQRIVIAIALSANPDILICDEPTTALDVTIQSQILELINVIKKERNLSVIFITHNLGVVANMADRVAVMYAGKIVEYGTAEDIFYDPRHPYTWALLSSMPDLHTKDKLESIPGTPPNMIYPPKGDAFADRNKYALEIDFELEPPLFEVSETHFAATWLLHPNAPKVAMPKIIMDRVERFKKEIEKNGQ